MNAVFGSGLAITTLGLLGYVAGVLVAYPGRSFSVTAVMVGITLVLVGTHRHEGGLT